MYIPLSSAAPTSLRKVARHRKQKNKSHKKNVSELKSHIEEAKTEINLAIENFNNVTEPKLIDFYIYKISSEQTRFEQLLSEYKNLENYFQDL